MADTLNDPAVGTAPAGVPRYVFVYGTLRRGEQRDINLLIPTPLFTGYAKIRGRLYDLGDYPGLRLSGSPSVQGEVYQITPELERQLDEIEEVWPQQSGEYARREVRVQFSDGALSGQEQTCLVYEIAEQRTAGMPVIASGDWLMRKGA